MLSAQVRMLGPERVRIPQSRGAVLVIRIIPPLFAVIPVVLLCLSSPEPGTGRGSGAGWFLLTYFVPVVAATWWVSRRPLLTIHERGIVIPNGRPGHVLRWDEVRVGFATSVARRLLIRPISGPAARSIITVDVPPEWVHAVAKALPRSEAAADAPTPPTQPPEGVATIPVRWPSALIRPGLR